MGTPVSPGAGRLGAREGDVVPRFHSLKCLQDTQKH